VDARGEAEDTRRELQGQQARQEEKVGAATAEKQRGLTPEQARAKVVHLRTCMQTGVHADTCMCRHVQAHTHNHTHIHTHTQ
jgi:hypothetical protein